MSTTQTFRAMNTTVRAEGIREDLAAWFAEVERKLSRFDPDSALSRLNASTGRWVLVEPLLYRAIAAALQAARMTGGAFDPTILGALEAAGYSQSFELGPSPAVKAPPPAGRWREIKLDPHLKAVYLPENIRLDLGGIGKGMAVDLAMHRQARPTEGHLLIDAGGDIAIRTAPGAPPVLVDVEDPHHLERTLATFALRRGSVATSSALGRRWGNGAHHIINPSTGRPADSGVVAATVFAPHTAQAEVLAKACIVLGEEKALQLLTAHNCQGIIIRANGNATFTPGLTRYEIPA